VTKVTRYAQFLMDKYDTNHDGVLGKDEWKGMHGNPQAIDQNGDGILDQNELTRWITRYAQLRQYGAPAEWNPVNSATALASSKANTASATESVDATNPPPAEPTEAASAKNEPSTGERRRDLKFYVPSKRLPSGLPDWFVTKDQDGDGQLTFTEFSTNGGAADVAEFERYDANNDGILTAKECSPKSTGKAASEKGSDAQEEKGNAATRKSATPRRNRQTAEK